MFIELLKICYFPFRVCYFGPEILFIPAGLFGSQMSFPLLDWKLLTGNLLSTQPSGCFDFFFSFPYKSVMDIFGQCFNATSPGDIVLVLEIAGR